MKSYGTILREMLKENHLTQKELAKRLGMTPQQLSEYVRGIRSPSLVTVRRINEAIYWWGDES